MSAGAIGDAWLVDANVALKWFLPVDREPDGALARLAIGTLAMRTTTLAAYEVGNILMRQSGWAPDRVAAALDLLVEICGDPLDLTGTDRRLAAELAHEHGLTFYDASYAAIAARLGRRLVSADAHLLDPGLAIGLRDAVQPA